MQRLHAAKKIHVAIACLSISMATVTSMLTRACWQGVMVKQPGGEHEILVQGSWPQPSCTHEPAGETKLAGCAFSHLAAVHQAYHSGEVGICSFSLLPLLGRVRSLSCPRGPKIEGQIQGLACTSLSPR